MVDSLNVFEVETTVADSVERQNCISDVRRHRGGEERIILFVSSGKGTNRQSGSLLYYSSCRRDRPRLDYQDK